MVTVDLAQLAAQNPDAPIARKAAQRARAAVRAGGVEVEVAGAVQRAAPVDVGGVWREAAQRALKVRAPRALRLREARRAET